MAKAKYQFGLTNAICNRQKVGKRKFDTNWPKWPKGFSLLEYMRLLKWFIPDISTNNNLLNDMNLEKTSLTSKLTIMIVHMGILMSCHSNSTWLFMRINLQLETSDFVDVDLATAKAPAKMGYLIIRCSHGSDHSPNLHLQSPRSAIVSWCA